MKPQTDQQQINAQARMSQVPVTDIPEKGSDEVKKDQSLTKPSEGIENNFYKYLFLINVTKN